MAVNGTATKPSDAVTQFPRLRNGRGGIIVLLFLAIVALLGCERERQGSMPRCVLLEKVQVTRAHCQVVKQSLAFSVSSGVNEFFEEHSRMPLQRDPCGEVRVGT